MPEFKLNGKTYSGSTSYASAISYTEDDGSKTTVQDKISELNSNFGVRYNEQTDMIEIYYNGEWKEWKSASLQAFYLYKDGNEIVDVTNGWSNVKYDDKYYNPSLTTITKGASYIELTTYSPNTTYENIGTIVLYTTNKVDLTEYSKIGIEYELNCNNLYTSRGCHLDVSSTTPVLNGSSSSTKVADLTQDTSIVYGDITNISGFQHIFVLLYNGSKSTKKDILHIKKIWLCN